MSNFIEKNISIKENCVFIAADVSKGNGQLVKEAASSDTPGYLEGLKRHYPVGRFGTPEVVAATICFLSSGIAPFVVGAAWSIDAGLTASSYDLNPA